MDSLIYFMAGLPRSGSTVLGAILRQNPNIHVTPTSPLYHYLVAVNECRNYHALQHSYDDQAITDKIYRDIVAAFYETRERSIVFDKNRMWPAHIEAIIAYINPLARIVCPVRPIAEIIASYLRLAADDPDNFIDAHLKKNGAALDNEARAHLLWTQYIKPSHDALRGALARCPKSVLLVHYSDLVKYPAKVLKSIYDFCGIAPFIHSFADIDTTNTETKDEAWRLRGLHDIRPAVVKTSISPYRVLPSAAVDYFNSIELRA